MDTTAAAATATGTDTGTVDHAGADANALGFLQAAFSRGAIADTDASPELVLWAHVLLQAISDARQHRHFINEVPPLSWVQSNERGTGTFVWLMELAHVPLEEGRTAVLARMDTGAGQRPQQQLQRHPRRLCGSNSYSHDGPRYNKAAKAAAPASLPVADMPPRHRAGYTKAGTVIWAPGPSSAPIEAMPCA